MRARVGGWERNRVVVWSGRRVCDEGCDVVEDREDEGGWVGSPTMDGRGGSVPALLLAEEVVGHAVICVQTAGECSYEVALHLELLCYPVPRGSGNQ
jgi:hypothetical protein